MGKKWIEITIKVSPSNMDFLNWMKERRGVSKYSKLINEYITYMREKNSLYSYYRGK